LARHRDDPNMPFWRMLKVGTDEFDLTLRPPKVDVCDRKYVFNADAPGATFDANAPCPNYTVAPALATALANKEASDDLAFQAASAQLDETERQAAAHAQQVAAEQQAAEQQAAAPQQAAAQPSLWDRLFHKGGAPSEVSPAAPAPAAAPPAPSAATVTGSTKVAAKVPEPRLRPNDKAATPPAAPAPTVGTFVKKKFIWPGGDDAPASGAADAGTPGQSL
jgi:NAD-dependent oxidoreductase involved in siderophore biosynthesis